MSSRPTADGRLRLTAVAVIAVAASITVALDWNSPVRAALVLAFLLFGPGLAIAELLGVRGPVAQLALAVGASLAIDTIVATALLYLEQYSYELAFAIVVALTGVVLVRCALRATPRFPEPRPRRADA